MTGAASAPTVLIVEDDAQIASLLGAALADEGYRTLTAVNGAALDVALRERPALILLDLMMPGMGGAEVSRRLATHGGGAVAHVPIVVMSAWDEHGEHAEGVRRDAWLEKPFELDGLYAVVARFAPIP